MTHVETTRSPTHRQRSADELDVRKLVRLLWTLAFCILLLLLA